MACIAAVAGCLIAPAVSHGAIISWIGGNAVWVDGNAGDAQWNPADEPDPDDAARFNAADVITMGSSNQISRLQMASRAELATAGWNLTVADGIQLTSGGGVRLTVDDGSTVSAGAWNVEPAAVLALDGGELQLRDQPGGGQGGIAGDAYLRGHGTVAALGFASPRVAFVNDGIILAERLNGSDSGSNLPGRLRFIGSELALIDLDGQSEGGILSVQDEQTLRVELALTDAFSGTLNLFGNSRFENQREWTLDGGTIYADNGADSNSNRVPGIASIAGAEIRQLGGTIHVTDADGRLNLLADFDMQGGAILNRGRLALHGQSRIAAGAVINGEGTLLVGVEGRLETAPGATLGINLENNGELRPGGDDAIGHLPMQGLQQTRDGALFLEIRGGDLASIDRLAVNAPAYLEGLLNVDLDSGFAPALGDTFEILTSVGGVRGRFQQLDVSGMPDDLTFQILYQPTAVLLQVTSKPNFAADFDDDGDVDRSDLDVWKLALGQSPAGDADGDLDTDGNDFLSWQRQFGSGGALANGTSPTAAVPEPSLTLAAFAAAAIIAQRRRQQSGEPDAERSERGC